MNTELFKINKYSSWYYNIISNAEVRKEKIEGGEKHHIIPACMGGIHTVILTKREHFICHLLLTKMVKNSKHLIQMNYALWLMSNCTYTPSSHFYEIIKSNAVTLMKISRKGVKKSNKAIINMSLSRRNKKRSPKAVQSMKMACKPPSRKGVKYSEEEKNKIKFLRKTNKVIKNYCPLFIKKKIKDLLP